VGTSARCHLVWRLSPWLPETIKRSCSFGMCIKSRVAHGGELKFAGWQAKAPAPPHVQAPAPPHVH